MRSRPTSEFRVFARRVIEAGADVFWGHSAHIVQGVEVWRGKPILYDTGDFVDDYAVDTNLRNDLSGLFLNPRPAARVLRIEHRPSDDRSLSGESGARGGAQLVRRTVHRPLCGTRN